MGSIEVLILKEISKDSTCALPYLANLIGVCHDTIREKVKRLKEENYIIVQRRRVKFLTLKGSIYLYEQTKGMDSDFAPRD